MKSFDYSLLHQDIPYSIAKQKVTNVPKKYRIFLLVVLIFTIIITIAGWTGSPTSDLFIVLFVLAFIVIGPVAMYIRYRKEVSAIAQLQVFADANDLAEMHNVPPAGYQGSLFDEGRDKHIVMGVKSKEKNPDIEIANYRYTTGSGRSSREHNYTYVRMTLDRNVPNIFIDSKKNNLFMGLGQNHASQYKGSQKLQFEGDFNSTFDVFVPEGYERDALYIMTPDVMHVLVEYGAEFDIELVDNTLIMFKQQSADITDPSTLETLVNKAARIAREFRDQTTMYSDERVASSAVNFVATPGQRLKKKLPVYVIIVVAYFLINFIFRAIFFS